MNISSPLRSVVLRALLIVAACAAPESFGQSMRAHFIDVGQGAATLLEFPCAAVLVDTGGEATPEFNGTDSLVQYLDEFFQRRKDLNSTLHSLILTHPHVDHTRGVKE